MVCPERGKNTLICAAALCAGKWAISGAVKVMRRSCGEISVNAFTVTCTVRSLGFFVEVVSFITWSFSLR